MGLDMDLINWMTDMQHVNNNPQRHGKQDDVRCSTKAYIKDLKLDL